MSNIVKNIQIFGLAYIVVSLTHSIIGIMDENLLSSVNESILLIIVNIFWFLFIQNIATYYEDNSLKNINFVSIFLFVFANILTIITKSAELPKGLDALLSLLSLTQELVAIVLFAVSEYKLYKNTRIMIFLIYALMSFAYLAYLPLSFLKITKFLNPYIDHYSTASELIFIIGFLQLLKVLKSKLNTQQSLE